MCARKLDTATGGCRPQGRKEGEKEVSLIFYSLGSVVSFYSNPLHSINWDELLDNFKRVQQAHIDYRRVKHKELIAKTT
jgi:hypothetical protein